MPKSPKYNEEGIYELDWEELRKELQKKKDDYDKDRNSPNRHLKGYDKNQKEFICKFWFFLSVRERKKAIIKLFPNTTYETVKWRVKRYKAGGGEIDCPEVYGNCRRSEECDNK